MQKYCWKKKTQFTGWEEIFTKRLSNKGLKLKMYRRHLNLSNTKTHSPIKKLADVSQKRT